MEPASRPAGSAGPAPAPPSRSLASDSPRLAVSRASPASVPPAAAPAPRAQTWRLAPRALTQSSAPGVEVGLSKACPEGRSRELAGVQEGSS